MERWLFVVGILLFVAVLAGKVSHKYGAPALLLFLFVGLILGNVDYLFGVEPIMQGDVKPMVSVVNVVSSVCLAIILLNGGLGTKVSSIRPVIGPGVVMATVGVLVTAAITGLFIYYVAPIFGHELSLVLSLLVASTMASTDSASVFSILRSKKCSLNENLRPLLELESGSNDPMAYVLVVMLTDWSVGRISGDVNGFTVLSTFLTQMILGGVLGFVIGKVAVRSINRFRMANESLYSVLMIAFGFMSYSFTSLVHGNGYLAIYITGLVLGNAKVAHRNTMATFLDSFVWLLQIIMFLSLGGLASIPDMFRSEIYLTAIAAALFMMFVARPIATFVSLKPFKMFSRKALVYTSWVGLRGAVPIVFVLYAIEHGIFDCEFIFMVVFICTLLSLILQGSSVSAVADWLGLSGEENESTFNMTTLSDNAKSDFTEVEVNAELIANGSRLMDIQLPDATIVFMVYRDDEYFVPTGKTELQVGDKLLVVSDDTKAFRESMRSNGITNMYEVE